MGWRFLTRALLFIALTAVWLPLRAAAQSARPTATAISLAHLGRLVTLNGSLLPRLAAAQRRQALPPRTRLELDIALRVRDQVGLDRFLHDVYDPQSPLYHHFLTPAGFAARFAPSPADRVALRTWLGRHGLHVASESANGLLFRTKATAGAAAGAFGTTLYHYVKGRERFYANATPVRLPEALTSVVLSVNGLDNAARIRPEGLHLHPRRSALDTPQGYSPSDLRSAYDLNPLYDAGLNGSGQSIAVPELADFAQGDISTYDQQFGLDATTPQRVQVPFNGQQAKTGGGGQSEAELDIEVVHAIAPQARLLVYVAPESESAYVVLVNQIVTDNVARVISNSWGFPENYVSSSYASTLDQILQDAAAQGIGVFAASGDNGAYDAQGAFPSGDPRNTALVVDFPSSDPWVTGVGGTSLRTSGGGYGGESVWSHSSDGSGSGGGLSKYFGHPDWQTGPGVVNAYSNGRRQTPDVSADADPATGFAVYTRASNRTGWHVFGGTSAAAPLWASYVLLDQQYLKTTIGFFNPTAYALGQKADSFTNAPYHDVTSGTNLHYPATPGWDYATGWGSMDGTALLNDIVIMGGPIFDRPSPSGKPIVLPTPAPVNSVSFRVYAHWEKAGSKGGPHAKGISSSKKGANVQMGLYFEVISAPPSLGFTASFVVTYRGKTASRATGRGNLDSAAPTRTYSAQKTYKPARAGTYTFIGKVSMGGVSIVREATLTVK